MPSWFTRPLTLGDEGDDVRIVQRKVQARVTGTYDEPTAVRVRGVQRKMGKKQTGVVDADTAKALGEKPGAGQVPEWFGKPEQEEKVREILRLSNIEPLDSAIRRFQSELGLELTGVVSKKVAVALSDRSY